MDEAPRKYQIFSLSETLMNGWYCESVVYQYSHMILFSQLDLLNSPDIPGSTIQDPK